MLVPSDRSNFSGPYFMGPWNYPGAFGAGPREGNFGRNDGATIWGQAEGGLFKYYAGVFNLFGDLRPDGAYTAPLFSGRLNLSLLNPEPGFYNSSTYYGKDILAIGVGAQFQRDSEPNGDTYGLFNADLLFEKDLAGSGVRDLEGAFYKYTTASDPNDFSYFALASYVTPEIPDVGKFQPLVRIQQTKTNAPAPAIIGATAPTGTAIDAQLGYVVDSYSTRLALGFQHSSSGVTGAVAANQLFLGVQLQK
jgi:hypothetical protein